MTGKKTYHSLFNLVVDSHCTSTTATYKTIRLLTQCTSCHIMAMTSQSGADVRGGKTLDGGVSGQEVGFFLQLNHIFQYRR